MRIIGSSDSLKAKRTYNLGKLEDDLALVEELKNNLKTRHQDWADYEDYYDADTQREKLKAKVPNDAGMQGMVTTSNFVFAEIEAYVANLMSASPVPYVVSAAGEQDDWAKQITRYAQAFGRRENIAREQEQAYRDTLVKGVGFLKVYWDKKEVAVKCIPPEMVYPDPWGPYLARCSYVALRNVYSEEEVLKLWSEAKSDKLQEADEADIDTQNYDDLKVGKGIEVWELYYDFGKNLVIFSGKQELYRGKNPTPGDKYPLAMFVMHQRSNNFWGGALVPYLQDLQDIINGVRTRMYIYLKLTASPCVETTDQAADIDTTPGSVWRHGPGTQAGFVHPPPLPPELTLMLQQAKADMDAISGVHEIVKGMRPKGTTSGISLEVLQQSAQIRLTGPARNWAYVLQDLWQTVVELMQKHYTSERRIPMLQGGGTQWASLSPNMLSNAAGGKVQPYEYEVLMDVSGELPVSQASLAETALRLWQLQVLSGPVGAGVVLDALRFPGRDRIMEQMQAEAQAAMQGQQAAQQQQASQEQQAAQEQARMVLEQHLPPEYMQVLEAAKAGQIDQATLSAALESIPRNLEPAVSAFLGFQEQLTQQNGQSSMAGMQGPGNQPIPLA